MSDLSRLLGLGRVADLPGRNNKLARTIVQPEQFGLGFSGLGVVEGATFGIHDHLGPGTVRLLQRLPEAALQRHAAAVEAANDALRAAGLLALRSPLPEAWRTSEGPAAADRAPGAEPVGARPSGNCTRCPDRPPRPLGRLDGAARALTVIPMGPLTTSVANARRARDERAHDRSPAHSTRVPAHVPETGTKDRDRVR
jgi:hypothetical protein